MNRLWRRLSGTRGVTLAAIASLAIGIGATTAVFSVAHALLLRPLPYSDADRLVILWNRSPGLNITEDWFSTAQYFDIKRTNGAFEQVALAFGTNYNLTGSGDPERVGVMRMSSNLLPMLGAHPLHGQLFGPEDDAVGRPGTAVLSYAFWTRRFGGESSVIDTSILLNGTSYQVVGILPESFRLPREVLPTLGVIAGGEIFLPLPLSPKAPDIRTSEDYNIVGKLKPGVDVAAAQAEMNTLTARLRQNFPEVYPPHGGLTFSVVPLIDQVVGNVRGTILVVFGSVTLLLLIACANVANLLLARAFARQRELAVRTALGATRARIFGALLGESVRLSIAGGVLGVLLAWLGVRWLQMLQPANVPRLVEIAIDVNVLLFSLTICLATGFLAGIAPVLGLRHFDLQRSLSDAARGSAGAGTMWGRGGQLRRLFVAVQIALATIVLVGAGLLVRTVTRLLEVSPGFTVSNLLTMEIRLTGRRYANGAGVLNGYRELWGRLAKVPGVEAVGGVTSLPLSGLFAWGPITVEGRTPPPGENFINADQRVVGANYFEAMQIPLRLGRFFGDQDISDAQRVVIVDEFMARELWPDADAVGKRIRLGDLNAKAPWLEVIGVVGRVKQYGLETGGRIAFYMPQGQFPTNGMYVVLRSRAPLEQVSIAVRQQVREMDPNLPVHNLRPMTALVAASMARQRFAMELLGIFAVIALALAAIGTYGVMAHVVAQGTRELGIRLALGATRGRILAMVLRHGLTVATAGLILGLAAASLMTRLMSSLIFGVTGTDPVTFAAVAITLTTTAGIATLVPALRASRVDPVVSLRQE